MVYLCSASVIIVQSSNFLFTFTSLCFKRCNTIRLIPLFKVSIYLILHTRLDYLATKLHEHLDVYYVIQLNMLSQKNSYQQLGTIFVAKGYIFFLRHKKDDRLPSFPCLSF